MVIVKVSFCAGMPVLNDDIADFARRCGFAVVAVDPIVLVDSTNSRLVVSCNTTRINTAVVSACMDYFHFKYANIPVQRNLNKLL